MSEKVERVMKGYKTMVMERKCLANQIAQFKGISVEEVIESMYFDQPDGERVQTSGPSDKTAKIAVEYEAQREHINEEWLEYLKDRYVLVDGEIKFFESAVQSLSGNLSKIISDMIINEVTWDDLANNYNVSRPMVAKYRRKAVHELDELYRMHDRTVIDFLLG